MLQASCFASFGEQLSKCLLPINGVQWWRMGSSIEIYSHVMGSDSNQGHMNKLFLEVALFSGSQIVKWLFYSLHPILIHRVPRPPFLLEDERAPSDLASRVTISESLLRMWRCEVLRPCWIVGFHLNFPRVLLEISTEYTTDFHLNSSR
jgi:hypothetical protein